MLGWLTYRAARTAARNTSKLVSIADRQQKPQTRPWGAIVATRSGRTAVALFLLTIMAFAIVIVLFAEWMQARY